MKAPDAHWPETTVIHDPTTAAVMVQIENAAFLRSFMRPGGNTVAAAAQEHQLTANAAFRKVKRFEALGLLGVLRLETRTGRAIRVYGCPAQRYFVPREVLPVDEFLQFGFVPHLREFWKQIRRALEQGQHPVTGILVLSEEESSYGLTLADQSGQPWNGQLAGSPAVLSSFTALELDYADAFDFNRELRELISKYRNRAGGTTYMFGLFMTPTVDSPTYVRD